MTSYNYIPPSNDMMGSLDYTVWTKFIYITIMASCIRLWSGETGYTVLLICSSCLDALIVMIINSKETEFQTNWIWN